MMNTDLFPKSTMVRLQEIIKKHCYKNRCGNTVSSHCVRLNLKEENFWVLVLLVYQIKP